MRFHPAQGPRPSPLHHPTTKNAGARRRANGSIAMGTLNNLNNLEKLNKLGSRNKFRKRSNFNKRDKRDKLNNCDKCDKLDKKRGRPPHLAAINGSTAGQGTLYPLE